MKQPLAFAVRPETLDEIIGQTHLVQEGKILRKCVEKETLFSMIFYGPPGTGKTTLAMVLANSLHRPYRLFNAVTGNKKELDCIFEEGKLSSGLVLIIDEIHRLNKDKQDLLLPHIEDGSITLIGATTANPFHSINPAIRSRTHLFEIKALSKDDIKKALINAIQSPKGFHNRIAIDNDALDLICEHSNGDIRFALNILEICALACENAMIHKELVVSFSQIPNRTSDKNGDSHYDTISAFQKAIRGSDVDAAIYYLGVLIEANDLDAIERRLLVCAYEDIGLANPAACARCLNAIDAAKRMGFPEGRIPLANSVIELSLSPKSKSAEHAIDKALFSIRKHTYPMPPYLKLTPINVRKEDQYDYTRSDLWNYIQYLPDQIKHETFYQPNRNSQFEAVLANNLKKLKQNARTNVLKELNKKEYK